MTRFHFLAGLPRSGSTLLANVLSQHPDVYVSGTSPLAAAFGAVVEQLGEQAEVIAELDRVPGAANAHAEALRGLVAGWRSHTDRPVVIDKGRGWIVHAARLGAVFGPETTIIAMVRDPRDVIASIEKQHRASAVYPSPVHPQIHEAASLLMAPDGLVGGPMRWVEDCLRRKSPNVYMLRYETLVADPQSAIGRLAGALGLDGHAFDLEDVAGASLELDALYRGKYPHDGSGAIKAGSGHWSDVLDEGTARDVAEVYPFFMQTFGYV